MMLRKLQGLLGTVNEPKGACYSSLHDVVAVRLLNKKQTLLLSSNVDISQAPDEASGVPHANGKLR